MNISANNSIMFKGLWGAETYIKRGMGTVELNKINRFYPFADDTAEDVKREFSEGLQNGVKNRHGNNYPFSDTVEISETLPFTKAEFEEYRSKNGEFIDSVKLTKTDEAIEKYMQPLSGNGLSMYRNDYSSEKSGLGVFLKSLVTHK